MGDASVTSEALAIANSFMSSLQSWQRGKLASVPPVRAHLSFLRCALILSLIPSSDARSQAPNAAVPSDWRVLGWVSGIKNDGSMRWPSATRVGDTLYIAANVLPAPDRSTDGMTAILLRYPGEPLALPAGHRSYAYPKGVLDRRRTYHLLWGESRNPVVRQGRLALPVVSSIWHAALRHGTWTIPHRIAQASAITWSDDQGSVAVSADNSLRVVTTQTDTLGRTTILNLRGVGKRWLASSLPGNPTYIALATSSTGLLAAVAYINRDTAAKGHPYTVFVRTSLDGGLHWSPPAPVVRSGDRVAYSPRLLLADSSLTLVWLERTTEADKTLRSFTSANLGRDWTPRNDGISLPRTIIRYSLAAPQCRGPIVLVEYLEQTVGGLTSSVLEIVERDNASANRSFLRNNLLVSSTSLSANGDTLFAVASTLGSRDAPHHVVVASRLACSPR